MKIGVIFCAYKVPDTVEESLKGWLDFKASGEHEVTIAAVSVPFAEYEQSIDCQTPKILESVTEIDYLVTKSECPVKEHEARNLCVEYLLKKQVDVIALWDGDEITNSQTLSKIFKVISFNKFVSWFRLTLKNYAFDGNVYWDYMVPRFFRVNTNGWTLDKMYWDNDFGYTDNLGNKTPYKNLPSVTIPKSIAFVKHLCWLNNNRSKDKVAYQRKHFSHCSFKWNEKENKLEFDEEYFLKTGEQKPILEYDAS